MKTCNTCAHSDNAHNDGSNELRECFEDGCDCKQFVDSGCIPCPFCGAGAWIIEAPSAAGGSRVCYDAQCVNELCAAQIQVCATKSTARRLWSTRTIQPPRGGEECDS